VLNAGLHDLNHCDAVITGSLFFPLVVVINPICGSQILRTGFYSQRLMYTFASELDKPA